MHVNVIIFTRMINQSLNSRDNKWKILIGFFVSILQTPGPGAYHVTDPNLYKSKTPQYSMTSRNPMPGDSTQKPGPGAHSPERVCSNTFSLYNMNTV